MILLLKKLLVKIVLVNDYMLRIYQYNILIVYNGAGVHGSVGHSAAGHGNKVMVLFCVTFGRLLYLFRNSIGSVKHSQLAYGMCLHCLQLKMY